MLELDGAGGDFYGRCFGGGQAVPSSIVVTSPPPLYRPSQCSIKEMNHETMTPS